MKTYSYVLAGLVASSSANIIFSHATLSCDLKDNSRMNYGCLREQECTTDGQCIPTTKLRDTLSFRNKNPTVPRSVARDDGRCGKEFNGATCDAFGTYGACCSEDGHCGSSSSHCMKSKGCQHGCSGFEQIVKSSKVKAVKKDDSSEPVIKGPTTMLVAGGAETKDGTCGALNNNTICGNWANGNCCSMYGFCGSTTGHCGEGCQSGGCTTAPAVQAPKAKPAPNAANPGSFQTIGQAGVGAMHAGLLPNGKIFFLDKLENYSQIKTQDGHYAMSAEYDVNNNQPVPISYSTNAFCSGGAYLADGRVVSVGGNAPLQFLNPNIGDGFKAIRTLNRSPTDNSLDGQPWEEPAGRKLSTARWYATAQTMPDGSVFVASGSLNGLDPSKPENNNPTYEMLNRDASPRGQSVRLDILAKNQPYYMYPFVNLLPDGNLFIFVAKQAQVFNVGQNAVVKQLPDLQGEFRTYPNTGGSVMLPLSSANNWKPEIVICGGGAFQDIDSPTDASCGRIAPLDPNPTWEMDSMPEGRGMVEGTLLPDGTSIWLNGGSRGAQGFGLMTAPTLEALHYDHTKPVGQRFSSLASSGIPRLYHSCALLMLDGTVMVVGSNPVEMPKTQPDAKDPYVTEYRVERFTPPYLQGENANKRPSNTALSTTKILSNGSEFQVSFDVPAGAQNVRVALYHGGYVTHSIHMGHRMLFLDHTGFQAGATKQTLKVRGPPNANLAPPGPYVVYVVADGIPSMGQSVQVS
ncbi:Aldehyde oxidase GLOX [Golovinomyces cichoracearum]|uniref:Aldehyde oxidase GLOX n=1 Tax=Golovinomyces cichoracearum TaxID=62708 RepID=A0A420IHL1_9PEZI|nr:Aldehyde oxidase GLOX [Golovinomyces cichoracearum]